MNKFDLVWERAKSFNVHQKRDEIKLFLEFLQERGKFDSFLEIGVNWGGTTSIFLEYFESGVGIDLNNCPFESRLHEINNCYVHITGNTQDKTIIELAGNFLYDMLFIDAGHTYDDVKKDFDNYRKFVKPGGIIAFHDISPDNEFIINQTVNVRKFWNEIKDWFEHYEFQTKTYPDSIPILNSLPSNWGGIGVIINE